MNFSRLVEVITSFTENTEASCSAHGGKCESEGESISNPGAAGRTPLQSCRYLSPAIRSLAQDTNTQVPTNGGETTNPNI